MGGGNTLDLKTFALGEPLFLRRQNKVRLKSFSWSRKGKDENGDFEPVVALSVLSELRTSTFAARAAL